MATRMTPSGRPSRDPFRQAVRRARGAADRAAEAEREKKLGRMEDILGRAMRNQGMEAREPMPPRTTDRKKGGSVMKMAKGGGVEKRGKTKGTMVKMAGGGKCYAKGGSVSSRADGIAKKGHTRGKVLAKGGMAKKGCK